MKTEIKLDETTLPNDMQHVKWMNYEGKFRKGIYIADEHMFAYVYDLPNGGISQWDIAQDVDSWSPIEDNKCLDCDWTGEQGDLHMVTQVDFKCPKCGSTKLDDLEENSNHVSQAFSFDNDPPVI